MKPIDALWRDIVFATRLLRKSPIFTAAIVLTLALGVGVNTALFSVVNAFLLRPLPVRDADRLVVIATEDRAGRTLGAVSFSDLQDYRAATSGVFEEIAGYSVGFLGLAPDGSSPRTGARHVGHRQLLPAPRCPSVPWAVDPGRRG